MNHFSKSCCVSSSAILFWFIHCVNAHMQYTLILTLVQFQFSVTDVFFFLFDLRKKTIVLVKIGVVARSVEFPLRM